MSAWEPLPELHLVNSKVILYGTFKILEERGNRFWKILEIEGPVGEYSDHDLLMWAGGSEYHGSRVERFGPTHAVIYAYED